MPKAGQIAKKPAKAPTPKKASRKRASDPIEDDPATFYSDDNEEQQEVLIVYGEIGSGKTYFTHGASVFWPKSLPAKKLITLEDCFTFQTDRKATAGMFGDNIRVPTFDVIRFMSKPEAWEHYFKNPPNWFQAVEIGIRKAFEFVERALDQGLRPKVIVDSLTGFDAEQFRRAKREQQRHENEGEKHNAYGAFGIHGAWHADFFGDLMNSGADILLNCHQRAVKDDSRGAKERGVVVKVAGQDASIEPDLIGQQAPKMYKRHATAEFLMQATRQKVSGRWQIKRSVIIGPNDQGGEAKDRYERILAQFGGRMSPPDLRKILDLVQA